MPATVPSLRCSWVTVTPSTSERESLLTNSASIMDLIHICELKLSVLKLEVTKKYSAGETDLWIPSISLGVEIRNSWDPEDEVALLRTLSDTNFRLQSRHLVVVVSLLNHLLEKI